MGILDIGVIVVYFAAIIALGVYGSRKAKTSEDYLLAGRKMGYPVTVACLSALLLGGASTVGTVGLGYAHGISGFWLVVMMGIGLILTGLVVIPKVHSLKFFTVSQLLETRYGETAGILSAVVSAVYTMMTCATQIIAMGAILQVVAGWDAALSMAVVGAVVIGYSMLGGMWTITMTDLVQFGFIVAGILFVMLPKSIGAAGGVSNLAASLPPEFFSLTNIGVDVVIQYFFLYALGIMVGQDIWQRFFTSRSIKVARRSSVAAGGFAFLYGTSTAAIGMCALVAMPGLENPQLVFGTFASSILDGGLLGLVVAGVLAALMSTASGTLIASASLVTNSIINPVLAMRAKTAGRAELRGQAADKRTLALARIMLGCLGAMAILVAVAFNDIIVALDVCYAILVGALFVPIMAGIYWKRATPKAAIVSVTGSTLAVFACLAIFGLTAIQPIVVGLGVSVVLTVGVSLWGKGSPPLPEGAVEGEDVAIEG